MVHGLKYLNEVISNKYSNAGILKINENKPHLNTHFKISEISRYIKNPGSLRCHTYLWSFPGYSEAVQDMLPVE